MPITVIDTLAPKTPTFPVVADTNVQGGFQVCATTAARDAIPLNNQKVGMLVYVSGNSTYYQLTATGTPGTYALANLGGSANLTGDVTGNISANTVASISGSGGNIPFNATIIGNQGSSNPVSFGVQAITLSADANYVLTAAQLVNPFLRFASSLSLTATRTITLPNSNGALYYVYNNTNGGQALLFKASTGTGVTVANGLKTAIYFDGTNYVVSNILVGGDLKSNSNIAQTVVGIQGYPVSSTVPGNDGYALVSLGGQYVPTGVAPVFNVKNFGAKGDGTTDDTAAINAAITATTIVEGTVYFPTGIYVLTSQLSIFCTVSLAGDTYLSSTLKWTSATNGIVWAGNDTQPVAGTIKNLAIVSGGTGLAGLTVQNLQSGRVDHVISSGWTQQGFLFLDTILTEMNLCIASSCGSKTGGLNGGDGYAAVEVDSMNVNGNGGGVGSTTFYMNNCNLTNNDGYATLRLDRGGPYLIRGGTCEGGGIPVQISSKSENTVGTNCVVIDGLDLELNVAGSVTCFVEIGYGLTTGVGFNRALATQILNCTAIVDTGFIPYGIKAKNSSSFSASNNLIGTEQYTGQGTIANIWFEGTTNLEMSVGINSITNSDPYIVVNAATIGGAQNLKPWYYTGIGINTTFYDYASINAGVATGFAGTNYTITPQFGTVSSGNVEGGKLIVDVQTSLGDGNVAGLEVDTDGTPVVSIGAVEGAPTIGSIGFGLDALERGNPSLYSAGGSNPLYIGGNASSISATAAIGFSTDNAFDLAAFNTRLKAIYCLDGLNGAAALSDKAPVTMIIKPEDAYSPVGATGPVYNNGADLQLWGGDGYGPTGINGYIDFHNVITTPTAPSSGSAGELPGQPAGYLEIKIGGVVQKIPYY